LPERGYVDPAEETDKVPFAKNASGTGRDFRRRWIRENSANVDLNSCEFNYERRLRRSELEKEKPCDPNR
jgi:hypothetical protein